MRGLYILIVVFFLISNFLTGCTILEVKQQHQVMASYCNIYGSVKPEKDSGKKIVVVLLKFNGGEFQKPENWSLFDHFVNDRPGKWYFTTIPGSYLITAFEDTNGDLIFQPTEPAISADPNNLFTCVPGEVKTGIELKISEQGRFNYKVPVDISKAQIRSSKQQFNISIGQATQLGTIVDLDDPRFSDEVAKQGLWRPFDFLIDNNAGLYFLEPYSSEKIPVLFVHGMNGTPRNFEYLIKNIDRKYFQPWLVYYPSGAYLDKVAEHLEQVLRKLKAQYGYKKLAVIAHSMGGLVARNFIFKNLESSSSDSIPLFVSIATPWDGNAMAKLSVDHMSDPVYAWKDMATGSPYLTELFYTSDNAQAIRRRLPSDVSNHLLFGFISTEAGDGTISLASQLRAEAQEEATRIYGYQKSHVDILSSPETAKVINKLLEDLL